MPTCDRACARTEQAAEVMALLMGPDLDPDRDATRFHKLARLWGHLTVSPCHCDMTEPPQKETDPCS